MHPHPPYCQALQQASGATQQQQQQLQARLIRLDTEKQSAEGQVRALDEALHQEQKEAAEAKAASARLSRRVGELRNELIASEVQWQTREQQLSSMLMQVSREKARLQADKEDALAEALRLQERLEAMAEATTAHNPKHRQ